MSVMFPGIFPNIDIKFTYQISNTNIDISAIIGLIGIANFEFEILLIKISLNKNPLKLFIPIVKK